jgi:hypothetical protein
MPVVYSMLQDEVFLELPSAGFAGNNFDRDYGNYSTP